MKMFLWQRVDMCTCNYHPEGGVLVFAPTEGLARDYANADECTQIREDEKPDLVTEVRDFDLRGKVFIFPDAGCC